MATPEESRKRKSSADKKEDCISWDDYFMAVAVLSAKRSKDPVTQVGACIVNSNQRIVGVGYNGMPSGCHDDEFPWTKETGKESLDSKFVYVCHAEMNAICNKFAADVQNCTMFVTLFPCSECAKLIIQSGIKKVVFLRHRHAHKIKADIQRSMNMLEEAEIVVSRHTYQRLSIELDMS